MTGEPKDPIARADAVVAAVDLGLSAPEVQGREVVLVTGPWLAGTTSVISALCERLPEHSFVEAEGLAHGEAPAAVVFVVSAIAPLTESDCALIDLASAHTDLVIGAVSKIDAHRDWRDVLAADRALLAAHAPRYQHMTWVGVAAAPDLGGPKVDELLVLLRQRLADSDVKRRNRLRAWETQLEVVMDRYRADGAGTDREARVTALRKRRDDIRRGRRLSKSERTIALRSQIQQARVQLTYFARNRCASVRAELQEDASGWGYSPASGRCSHPLAGESQRRLGQFETYVHRRVGEVVDEVDDGITHHMTDVATELRLAPPPPAAGTPDPPDIPAPPLRSRGLETRLMIVLGAGFGLGVALAVGRLFAGLAPGLTVAALVAGGLVGLLLTVWVVGMRGLLHDRAVLDRWITDVTGALRSAVEELVATRVLAAETALSTQLAALDEVEGATASGRIADIDAELREHAIATARAAALRDRRLPTLQRALDAVRTELYGGAPARGRNGSTVETSWKESAM